MVTEFKKLAKICNSAVIRTEGDKTEISLIFRDRGFGIPKLPTIAEGIVKSYKDSVWVSYEVEAAMAVYTGKNALKCFARVGCCQVDERWQTMLQCIKPHDKLSVRWVLGNNSQLLNERGLYHDSCDIVATRNKKKLYFQVEDRVSLQDSARMAQL
jgi:hypothetical protein